MAKNQNEGQLDKTEDKAGREAEAAAKAKAYASEQAEAAAKAKADAEAEAAAKREAAENETVDSNLVKMKKDGQILAVHASTVVEHRAVGWEIL